MPPQQQHHNRAQVVVELVSLLVTMAGSLAAVWLTLPPQQRMWIRLAAAGRVRSAAARMAWATGHRGMAEELRTGQRSILYLAAWGLSTVRDQAHQALEDMRP